MKTVNSKRQGMKQKHVIHQALSEKKTKLRIPRETKEFENRRSFQRLTNQEWQTFSMYASTYPAGARGRHHQSITTFFCQV